MSLGNASLDRSELVTALSLYAKALEIDPLFAEAHLFSGIALHLSNDPGAAARALRSALFLNPELWPASYYLALSYGALGQEAKARLEYRRVVVMSSRLLKLESHSSMLADLEGWKRDVIELASRRAGP